MKFWARLIVILLGTTAAAFPIGAPPKADPFRQLKEATALPMRLDPAFEFRKTKLFVIGDPPGPAPRQVHQFTGGVVRDEALTFEGAYRLFGAVTELDKRQRWGHYLDFFWRGKREGPVTVRLEYRQQNLRAFVQAREVDYANGRGNHKTEFQVIGDDFFEDGRITAWRCLLIANGAIVAEDKSFMWR